MSGQEERRGPHAGSEPSKPSPLRHYGGFILAGSSAFVVDAGVLEGLRRLAGMSPFTARVLAIAAAMVVAWLINRTVTFPVRRPPGLTEFLSYAALAWGGALLNYAIYAAILLIRPATVPFWALACASGIGMVYSYVGMRFGVFRKRPR